MTQKRKRYKRKIEEAIYECDSDDHFAFIAGYTSGGAPYGIAWDELQPSEHVAPNDDDCTFF